MLLSFMVENDCPFTMAPKIISLTKAMMRDRIALNSLSMDRTTAQYKLKHGLSFSIKEDLIERLKETPFSLNIDECSSETHKKVLSILVNFYNKNEERVVCYHLESVALIKTNAASVFEAVTNVFSKHGLEYTNLISILMDSCNVMRGSKEGFEQQIKKKKAPHLLDIDGDSCHHIHNISKKFCEPFDRFVERLLLDLHTDCKWSPDVQLALDEICCALGEF